MSQIPEPKEFPNARGAPLSDADRVALRTLVVRHGERGVMRLLGVSRHTLVRALSGLGMYAPTIFMIRQRLTEVLGAAGEGALAPQSNPNP